LTMSASMSSIIALKASYSSGRKPTTSTAWRQQQQQ
jgi:hypothetical protein